MSFSVDFLLATFLGLQPGQQDVKSIDTSLLYRWYIVVVVQSLSAVWFFATPWTAACQVFLSFTISQIFSNSTPLSQWCHPTILSSVARFCACLNWFCRTVLARRYTPEQWPCGLVHYYWPSGPQWEASWFLDPG